MRHLFAKNSFKEHPISDPVITYAENSPCAVAADCRIAPNLRSHNHLQPERDLNALRQQDPIIAPPL
jgi:hypothetical protein